MQIHEIREEIHKRNRLMAKRNELSMQREDLRRSEESLRAVREKERQDVERLEGGSLAGFFYGVTGKKAERLDKEKREAYEAAVKHDTVAGELAAVDDEIRRIDGELQSLEGLEHKLERAVNEKKEWLKENCPQKAQQILDSEERIAGLQGQLREIKEALSAGKDAARTANEVRSSLNSAEGWGTWDMLGGGLIATMAKHSHLDSAQDKVNVLQQRLRAFRTELVDIEFHEDIQVQIEGFLRFADYFWDGIFSDWMVQGKIHDSQKQIDEVISKVDSVVLKLQNMDRMTGQELDEEKAKLERLVEQSL